MLDAVAMLVHIGQMTGRAELFRAFDMVTTNPAKGAGVEYGVKEGAAANFVVFDCEDEAEAIRLRPAARWVVRNGRIVAETEPARSVVHANGESRPVTLHQVGRARGAEGSPGMTTGAITQEGMPTHEGDLSIEAHGFEPIPESARYGSVVRIFTVWFTPNLVPAAFFIGTLAAADFLQVGFVTGVLAIVVGNLIGSALVGALSTMGPATGMAQMPLRAAAVRQEHRRPGRAQLAELHRLGRRQQRLRRRGDHAADRPAVPDLAADHRGRPGLLGVIGYEAIHTFEKYMAIVLGVMFVVLTVAIVGKAELRRGPTASPASTSSARSSCSRRSRRASWSPGACTHRTTAAICRSTRPLAGLLVHGPRPDSVGRLDRDPRPARGRQGHRRRGRDDQRRSSAAVILGALAMIAIAIGTVAVNAMNDYTGLAVAPGGRVAHPPGLLGDRGRGPRASCSPCT